MPKTTVTQAIAAWPFSLGAGETLGVALSGGADSTALLLACARRWPGQVVALPALVYLVRLLQTQRSIELHGLASQEGQLCLRVLSEAEQQQQVAVS